MSSVVESVFPFLIGRIKSESIKSDYMFVEEFPFLIGRIKSRS